MLFSVYCSCAIVQSIITAVGESNYLPLPETVDATRVSPCDHPIGNTSTDTSQLLLLCETFYIWTVLFLKLSVGLFYLRLAAEKWQRGVVWFLMGISTAFSLALFFLVVFQCGVPSDMVEFVIKKATKQGCITGYQIQAVTFTHAAITAFTDWVFVALPFFILRKTKMQGREKAVVGILMAFASIGGVAALVRFKYVPGISQPQETFFSSVTDIAIWSCVEPGIGIAAGSFICLRPLFKRPVAAASRAFGYVSSGRKRSDYGHELTSTSETNLRSGPDDWQKQFQSDPESAYEMHQQTQQPSNGPFTPDQAPQRAYPSEKELHRVLDTRHQPRKGDAGLPVSMFGSNRSTPKSTPIYTRDAWIDDNDSR